MPAMVGGPRPFPFVHIGQHRFSRVVLTSQTAVLNSTDPAMRAGSSEKYFSTTSNLLLSPFPNMAMEQGCCRYLRNICGMSGKGVAMSEEREGSSCRGGGGLDLFKKWSLPG